MHGACAQDVAESCRTGAATNIIFGLALGYKSVIVPVFGIAFTIFVAYEARRPHTRAAARARVASQLASG